MKSSLFRLVFACVGLATATVAVHAQDLGAVKARIEQRISAVNALKDKGVAGENNRGYLEARGAASGEDNQVISEENSDRRTVYAALASRTGSSADQVGKQRAQQILANAKRGHWVQETNGEWKQKG